MRPTVKALPVLAIVPDNFVCLVRGTVGEYDLTDVVNRDSSLTRPLRDPEYLRNCYLELGALCWPNGLELRGGAIHRRLAEAGLLRPRQRAAGQS